MFLNNRFLDNGFSSKKLILILVSALLAACGESELRTMEEQAPQRSLAKFEPKGDKVLVFVGQDNLSVGGTDKWQDGYVDHVGVPAGITHYVYFTENKTNDFGFTFDVGTVDGLNKETTWGAGPMCMSCYLESEKLQDSIVHLSISMEFGSEDEIAAGEHDHLIEELGQFLTQYQHVPFLIRIGYEFEGSWNDYDAPNFKMAWRRIVDGLRQKQIDNFATVFASSRYYIDRKTWDEYWPGDEYVDWIGYSYWASMDRAPTAFELAKEKGKPVFIAEITPHGFWFNKADGDLIWFDWFEGLFDHIEKYPDQIKAISYINSDWDSQPMWTGWGDTRIEINDKLKKRWLEKMATDKYVHSTEGAYSLIGFEPK